MGKRQKGLFKFKQFTICQEHAAQKVGTDSDLLGALAPGGVNILDIGAGTGVLTLMMAQRFPNAYITAVEIDDDAIVDLEVNINRSPYANRVTMVHDSFQNFNAIRRNYCKLNGVDVSKSVKLHLKKESLKPVDDYRTEETAMRDLHGVEVIDNSVIGYFFDAIVCNPPYFDLSLECPDEGRTRARHSSSLPFEELIKGAYELLSAEGVFTVCIPPEVEGKFDSICLIEGFWLDTIYRIKSVPEKPVKRLVITYRKGRVETPSVYEACMRDAGRNVSKWYKDLMKDFLINVV